MGWEGLAHEHPFAWLSHAAPGSLSLPRLGSSCYADDVRMLCLPTQQMRPFNSSLLILFVVVVRAALMRVKVHVTQNVPNLLGARSTRWRVLRSCLTGREVGAWLGPSGKAFCYGVVHTCPFPLTWGRWSILSTLMFSYYLIRY